MIATAGRRCGSGYRARRGHAADRWSIPALVGAVRCRATAAERNKCCRTCLFIKAAELPGVRRFCRSLKRHLCSGDALLELPRVTDFARSAVCLRRVATSLAVIGSCLLAGCASELPVPTQPWRGSDARLPHAVLADGGNGRNLHLHVAPLVEGGRFTSGFGWRQGSVGGGAYHRGLDIAASAGAPVRAAASGQVVEFGRRGSFGRMVRIRHSINIETIYAHLSRYAQHLEVGRQVRQDEVIGYVGSSGRATGPHLHFEVRRNGWALDPLALPPQSRGG